jgi:hypothetical protein
MHRKDPQLKLILAISSETLVTGVIEIDAAVPNTSNTSVLSDSGFAKLRSMCELDEEGILLVCKTEKPLNELFTKRSNEAAYSPAGVQRQINFMLGKPKFKSAILIMTSEKALGATIIFGAHISHRNIDAKHAPSIAAMVASTDITALNYPDSMHFQRTTAPIQTATRS